MNNAHIDSKAVPGQRLGMPALVRRLAACCLIGAAAMSAAQAGPRERERDAQAQRDTVRAERQQRQPDERQGRQYDARAYDTRNYDTSGYDARGYDTRGYDTRGYDTRGYGARAEDPRRNRQSQPEQPNSEASRRNGRLTPDERRDLRRQINEAGADIYPRRKHR